MLSQMAQDFAAEIAGHDWSDAPYRADRAGHQRSFDGKKRTAAQLSPSETEVVVINVMWVVAQQLASVDPNFNVHEFAEACGVARRFRLRTDGSASGAIPGGLRPEDYRVQRTA
ncbi:hypothetical protein [Curtobacterium sp. MCLR17_042]|uniref:hypothetical protein n=1 Tax=Curtobacterium sp. MCLR17_042 TaxID=2175626 RepID=UPI000DAA7892|nr:hypothetical protein [Curtobacterium sp. MCLR17_042]PZE31757.1 hypothetical protein DEJ02_00420 [Curtobacterium sp. MCLR17_042]